MKLNEKIEIARGFFPIVSDLCESLANGLDHMLVDYTIANYQDIIKRQYSMKYEQAILNYLNVNSLLSEVTR